MLRLNVYPQVVKLGHALGGIVTPFTCSIARVFALLISFAPAPTPSAPSAQNQLPQYASKNTRQSFVPDRSVSVHEYQKPNLVSSLKKNITRIYIPSSEPLHCFNSYAFTPNLKNTSQVHISHFYSILNILNINVPIPKLTFFHVLIFCVHILDLSIQKLHFIIL